MPEITTDPRFVNGGATRNGGRADARHHAPAVCSCTVDLTHGRAGPILVLRVAGEVDMSTLPALEQSLMAAVGQRPRDLVVDLAAVAFCSVRGFTLLDSADDAAQADQTRIAVSGLSRHLTRVAALLWVGRTRALYPSAAAAVTALRVEQSAATRSVDGSV